MDLFRAPRLNAQDYLVRIAEAASGAFENSVQPHVSDGNRDGIRRVKGPNFLERPFFQTQGEPLSAEILYLKLHLLETLTAELLHQGETLSHPQIPQTLDRVWLRADHRLSHIPYFWRFTLDWLEPSAAPPPTDFPQSGMGYCLNSLALIWQSVLEFDPNRVRQNRQNSMPHSEVRGSKEDDDAQESIPDAKLPKASWEKKIIQEAIQVGNALSQAAHGESFPDSAAFLQPIRRLKNQLWERIFNPAPHPAQPEAFPAELQAALHRIADRWEEKWVQKSPIPEEAATIEESPPEEEEPLSMEDDEDEFITETIVMSAPEDTARLELEAESPPGSPPDLDQPETENLAETMVIRPGQSTPPPPSSEDSAPPPEPEDSLAQTVALRKGSGKPKESEKSSSEAAPETPRLIEETLAETVVLKGGDETQPEFHPPPSHAPDSQSNAEPDLAETVVLKNGGGPRPDSPPRPPEAPGPSPSAERDLAETVVLRGSGAKENGRSHAPPPPPDPPDPPDDGADDLAATVVVRPRKTSSAPSAAPKAEETDPNAPENETESPDSLTETVILRPGRSKGKERP